MSQENVELTQLVGNHPPRLMEAVVAAGYPWVYLSVLLDKAWDRRITYVTPLLGR